MFHHFCVSLFCAVIHRFHSFSSIFTYPLFFSTNLVVLLCPHCGEHFGEALTDFFIARSNTSTEGISRMSRDFSVFRCLAPSIQVIVLLDFVGHI